MTIQERQEIKNLIPDLLPPDHVSISTKRINFIYGQGIVIFDDVYAVEIYVPHNANEHMTYFAVDRHYGKTHHLGQYYQKLRVLHYDHPDVTEELRGQFNEAVSLQEPEVSTIERRLYTGDVKKVA
jgi:hypothetical protein